MQKLKKESAYLKKKKQQSRKKSLFFIVFDLMESDLSGHGFKVFGANKNLRNSKTVIYQYCQSID